MKLKDSRGRLTAYALACGYVETKRPLFRLCDANDRLTLSRENNLYFVKGFIDGKHIHTSYHTLKEARRFLTRGLRLLKR